MSIFEGFLSTPETLAAFSDSRYVEAMLRFEAVLAQAQAAEGLMTQAVAQAIVDCCDIDLFDVPRLVSDSRLAGSVAIPLVKSLREAVAARSPEAAPFVHFGGTSQDVIDTAMALVTRDVVEIGRAHV